MEIHWKENIKKYLLASIQNNKSWKLYSVLIWKPIVYYFWEVFAEDFMNLRVENNIFLRSLRVYSKNFDLEKHKDYYWYNKEIKHIESNNFKQSMFLYDSKILIFDMKSETLEFIDNLEEYNKIFEKFNSIWNS